MVISKSKLALGTKCTKKRFGLKTVFGIVFVNPLKSGFWP
jgi:hypothetical protein